MRSLKFRNAKRMIEFEVKKDYIPGAQKLEGDV